MKMVEFYEYNQIGYQKLFHYNSWRIAILNYIDELDADKITFFENHTLTDEAFVLLQGEVVIYILSDNIITGYKLKEHQVCNIKKGVYHSHVLSHDAKLLIIEEESTNFENSDRIYLDSNQKQQVIEIWRNRNEL